MYSESSSHYRPDIDGIRALAVVPVVLYHAHVPGFSGGFAGVDVFFVISGYLITRLICADILENRFSIADFYERRIRRIFPALFLMLAITSIAATWLLLPGQVRPFGESLFATVLFGSNFHFASVSDGYFAASAAEQPLLHTWSLAVEEQFYLVLPLFLLAVHRWAGGRWIAWSMSIAVLSLAAAVWSVAQGYAASFYWTPTRAWELLLGSLLALNAVPAIRWRPMAELVSAAGVAAIGWAVFMLSSTSSYPGLNALFPCLGAALAIHGGSCGPTFAGRVLGSRPLVFVGLISYSLYLWHWPIIVFAGMWNIVELSPLQTAGVIVVAFCAAVLSWKFVETPFRQHKRVIGRKFLFRGALAAFVLLAAFGHVARRSDGWPARFSPQVMTLAAATKYRDGDYGKCSLVPGNRKALEQPCVFGGDRPPTFAVWGDSHADALAAGVGEVAARHDASVVLLASLGCSPVIGLEGAGRDYPCIADHEALLGHLLASPTIHTVIMIGRFTAFVDGLSGELGPAERGGTTRWGMSDGARAEFDLGERRRLFKTHMEKTIKTLLDAGKRIALVYPIPEVGYNVPHTLARIAAAGGDATRFTRPLSVYLARNERMFEILDGLGPSSRITRIYPHKQLCNTTECFTYGDGKPLYYDDNHPGSAGARFLGPIFEPLFAASADRNAAGRD